MNTIPALENDLAIKQVADTDKMGSMQSAKKPKPEVPPVLKLLCQKFPKAFDLKVRKPLKIGIYQDVLEAFEGNPEITPESLATAIRYYSKGFRYQINIIMGLHRINLEGENVSIIEDHARILAVNFLKKYGNYDNKFVSTSVDPSRDS